jgi:hypothetical protein
MTALGALQASERARARMRFSMLSIASWVVISSPARLASER